MGEQGVERREILPYIGIAPVAATFPGFKQWAFTWSHQPAKLASSSMGATYAPLFFTPQQYRMVEHRADMIIPADDTLGASEAGVAEFIDYMATPCRIARERAWMKRVYAVLVMTRKNLLPTSGRKLTTCRTCISVTRAFSPLLRTRPPRCRSSLLLCAPALPCWRSSVREITGAFERGA